MQLACTIALAFFTTMILYRLDMNSQQKELSEKMEQINEQYVDTINTLIQLNDILDNIYNDKVESLAYMVREQIDPALSEPVMNRYCELLGVDNVLVLDTEGNILAQAKESPAKFGRSRYNMLRTVFEDHQPSQSFRVRFNDYSRMYYGAWIDDERMAVIENSREEIDQLYSNMASWSAVLEYMSIGLYGFPMLIDGSDYTFRYYPDPNFEGQDALAAGIKAEDLYDGNMTWFELYGESFYGAIMQNDYGYVICAVGADEIISEFGITIGIVLFIFITVTTVVIAYARALLNESKRSIPQPSDYWHIRKIRIHKLTASKIAFASALGLICLLSVSLFMQTLYNLSSLSLSFAQRFEEAENTVTRHTEDMELLTAYYNRAYLSKAQTAAYILSRKPEMKNRNDLGALSEMLDVEYTFIFDRNGVMTATDSPYSNFSLSRNEEDQSYAFNVLLQGVPYLIQEARLDDIEHIYRQYVGVTLRDEAGEADGFVQISVYPELLEDAIKSVDIGVILRNIKIGQDGFAFAVDDETKDIVWYLDERMIGRNALDYGLQEEEFISGDGGFITLLSETYYTSVEEIDNDFIFMAIPRSEIIGQRAVIPILTTLFSLAALGLIGIVAVIELEGSEESEESDQTSKRQRRFILHIHGLHRSADTQWDERTPEQKVLSGIRGFMLVLAAFICIAIIYKDRIFNSTSIIRYIIDGTWRRGFNIFSVTSCMAIILIAFAGTTMIRSILKMLSGYTDARNETVLHLLSNITKYAAVIVTMYYCLVQFGVNPSTLLASAGILSLVIGLGAQSLITDILAGLFIIFEGVFQVGDFITIGDWYGKVVEIGVRTTKVEDKARNIKVFNNSTISGVINMTKKGSAAYCKIAIDYGESLERVETILKGELPNMHEHLKPKIIDGPIYLGVTILADYGVVLGFIATCTEANRSSLTRKLNRELKLVFDKYNIQIPYPQVVVHEPSDFTEASEWRKQQTECTEQLSEVKTELPPDDIKSESSLNDVIMSETSSEADN